MAEPSPEALRARYESRLRDELEELKRASGSTSAARRPVELDQQSTGRLSRMDAMQNQAMAAGVDARRHARIRAISAALGRIEVGEFGYCSSCGEYIGEKRLDLDPVVTHCIECFA